MKINKIILVGILFIIIGCVIYITDSLTPIIRPITHIFLMGSSKGKDIIFFGLMGMFLIFSQLKNKKFNPTKYLKISIVLGSVLLISGILLEIIFRCQLGIGILTIFMSPESGASSTSILHTHIFKSIFANILTIIQGPPKYGDINIGLGLYRYIPEIASGIMILFPILFITLVLAIKDRPMPTTIMTSFFGSCLLIGALDGGLFSTPALTGISGLYLIYRNGYYFDYYTGILLKNDNLVSKAKKNLPPYKREPKDFKFTLNRILPYIVIIALIVLRISVGFIGTEADYYTLEITNLEDNIEITGIDIESISVDGNTTTYIIDPNYNEMELLNHIKTQLYNHCDYYTLSWNMNSYLGNPNQKPLA